MANSIFVICLLLVFLARGASSQANATSPEVQIEQAVSVLKRGADADSLAAAALLSIDKHRDQALPLIERALAMSPMRAELVWLQYELCQKLESCDPIAVESRLRDVDPSNAAAWIGALARANASNDEKAVEVALAAIGQRDRFDIYWTTLISRLSEAVIRSHKMAARQAVVTIIGYLAAEPIPGYGTVSRTCKGDRLQRPAVNEACRAVAHVLRQGDTYLSEMIGVAIAKRVWPEVSSEWKAADEARRLYDYRSKLIAKLDEPDDSHVEQYLALCSKYRREQDVWLAQITDAGLTANPPVD